MLGSTKPRHVDLPAEEDGMKISEHLITLQGQRLVLRPLTEDDWDVLLRWNSDPEVLYFSDGDDVAAYTLDQIQPIYRSVSQTAFYFIMELEGRPIGECQLQRMNLARILERYPGLDCRRIDLMIGEKALWGRGLGTEALRLLCAYAFEVERADLVFGCGVADYNVGSQKAFQKAGFVVDARIEDPADNVKARWCYDFVLRPEAAGR